MGKKNLISRNERWEIGMEHLNEYRRQFGNTIVPIDYICEDGYRLGPWAARQKQLYRKNQLSAERYEKLLASGLDVSQGKHYQKHTKSKTEKVTVIKRNVRWRNALEHLIEYKNQFGHTLVPASYVCEDGFKLGLWVKTNRTQYKKQLLIPERIKSLLEAGLDLSLECQDISLQERGLEHLKEYVERFGNACVPTRYVCEDGYRLGAWITTQKIKYKKGRLNPEVIRILFDAGLDDDALTRSRPNYMRKRWKIGLEHLKEYVNRFGSASIPHDYVCEDGYCLGTWVAAQKNKYKKRSLTAERNKDLLEAGLALPEAIASRDQYWAKKWKDGLDHLKEYVKRFGSASMPSRYVCDDGYRLGSWVSARKHEYNTGALDDKKAMELIEAGFDFRQTDIKTFDKWRDGFRHLVQYRFDARSLCVPYNYVCEDGFLLGQWVADHLDNCTLADLGVCCEDANGNNEEGRLTRKCYIVKGSGYKAKWERKIKYMLEYKEKHGDFNVPINYVCEDGFRLGKWYASQIAAYNAGKLPADRQDRLKSLGIPFCSRTDFVGRSRKLQKKWELALDRLKEYKKEHGTVNVPYSYRSPDGFRLGVWLSLQKQQYKKHTLWEERVRMLQESGVLCETENEEPLIKEDELAEDFNGADLLKEFSGQE